MNDTLFEDILFLYCINKSERLQSSYHLIKLLSWKYKIIHFSDISARLRVQILITEEIVNRINYYSIAEEGKVHLANNLEVFKKELLSRFPEQREFSQLLLQE